MGKPLFTNEQFKAAIPGSGGLFAAIAKKVGCEWHTAQRRILESPTLKRLYDDECALILDIGEQELLKAVKAGEPWAIKFFLSTKGKDRGYSERHEVTGKDDGPLTLRVVYENKRANDSTAYTTPATS